MELLRFTIGAQVETDHMRVLRLSPAWTMQPEKAFHSMLNKDPSAWPGTTVRTHFVLTQLRLMSKID